MILKIPDVLSLEELQRITTTLKQAEFVDGNLTAGWHAKRVKHNQQLAAGTATATTLKSDIETALSRNDLFQAAVRPKIIHSLLFSRYDAGMSYGTHTDNALMGGTAFWRSDVSFTIFLNAPSEYDGGELVIEGADDEQAYKLNAGMMLVYPSTTLHRVDPVILRQGKNPTFRAARRIAPRRSKRWVFALTDYIHGTRWVIVGWVQSLVRDASKREILFDLETARRAMFAKHGKTSEFDLISKSIANLLRRWAE